jgi:AcrR family transcriptional regulator
VKPTRSAVDHRTRVGHERSARTESRILEAALGVFAERGPDAPVIDEFVQAAGISRGTFYNHFESVEQLLHATSEWTTREVVQAIEDALAELEGPTLRLGVGLRLFLAHAQRDPVWCRFVARVWTIGGLELPLRDLEAGIRLGHFRVPSRDAAHDVLFGGMREAMLRIGERRVPAGFGDQVAELCLQTLGAEPRHIAAALARELPRLQVRGLTRAGDEPDEAGEPARPSRSGARAASRSPRRRS